MSCAAPDWINALSTLWLAIFSVGFGVYQFWKSGFRPLVTAEWDVRHRRVVVLVENQGRGSGSVYAVDVVASPTDRRILPNRLVTDSPMETLPQVLLNPGTGLRVVREAAPGSGSDTFPAGAAVFVAVSGRKGEWTLTPTPTQGNFDDTVTQLPPTA